MRPPPTMLEEPRFILFVCTGNTCRSPMAKALMDRQLRERDLCSLFRTGSAGICAVAGMPASDLAVEVMGQRGIDLSDHRASRVDALEITPDTLIIAMTRRHADDLVSRFPEHAGSVYLLGGLAGGGGPVKEVPDPFGGSRRSYEDVACLLETLTSGLADLLATRKDRI